MQRVLAFCTSVVVAGVIVVTALGAAGSVQVVARIDTGQGPCSETGGLGSVWVGVANAGTLARIDPAANAVTGSGGGRPRAGGGPIGARRGLGGGYREDSGVPVGPARMEGTK